MTEMIFDTKPGPTPVRDAAHQRVDAQELYGLLVDTDVAFSNHKGIYKPGFERRQRSLLKKLSFLAPFLEPREKILQVTTGCSPLSFLEQLLTGAILYSLKRALFVFTDRRILHIPCSPGLNYRNSIAQILYADCRNVRIRFSTLIASYKSGLMEKFPCISRKNRKKLKAILKNASRDGQTSPELGRAHLCPQCSRPLIKNYYACPHCSLKFKKKSWAAAFSIIFPGGGYFYTRHPWVGLLEAMMELAFTFTLALFVTAFSMRLPFNPQELNQAIVICATVIVFEKLVTIFYAEKAVEEFIPSKRRIQLKIEEVEQYHVSSKVQHVDTIGWRSR